MTEIDLYYVEALDETNNILIFSRMFNKKPYGRPMTLNLVLPVEVQDIQIRKVVELLKQMTRKDIKEAV